MSDVIQPVQFTADSVHAILYGIENTPGVVRDRKAKKLDKSSSQIETLTNSLNKMAENWASWNSREWLTGFIEESDIEEHTANLLQHHHKHAVELASHWPALGALEILLPETKQHYDLQITVANLCRTINGDAEWRRRTDDLHQKLAVLTRLHEAIAAASKLDIAFGWDERIREWPKKHLDIVQGLVEGFKQAIPNGEFGYSHWAAGRFVKTMVLHICRITVEEQAARREVQRLEKSEAQAV